jgi:hypothetical protein
VVWRGKPSSDYAGKVFVSMRGTQGFQDISDDISLAFRGIPHQQIADMANWWLKETAIVGSLIKQIRVQETGNLLSVYELVAGTPYTATRDGDLVGVTNITAVNGHSLGGYLATAFTRLFGSHAGVQSVNTFNSAGFANASAFNTETEFNKVATLLGLTGSFAAVGAIQTNYFAQNGISFTTNSLADMRLPGFSQYGRRVAAPDAAKSCQRDRRDKRFTTNSIAACTHKQRARGRSDHIKQPVETSCEGSQT